MKQLSRHEKALRVMEVLQDLFPEPEVPLDHSDPYTLLIAVLLSAQCTDERVNRITPALFRLASTPEAMAQLTVEAIDAVVRPCGLSPTKARNIHALSQLLLERHSGQVPTTLEELEALPGVGHKTASVVMAQAFGVPSFPVDTHIHRLMTRWGLTDGRSVVQTERDAKALFPADRWNVLHIQIILYGRAFSPARGLDPDKDILLREIGTPEEQAKWGISS
jgi:endonuclease-3